jgi:Holliday junction resolvase
VRPILRSGGKAANGNPIIDLNEAIRKDMVFLPDSLVETQQVKYVIDLKTGERVGFDEACKSGICF